MSDKQRDAVPEGFASLFESSLPKKASFKPGQALDTHVVAISGDSVFVELNGKSEGVLERAELCDKDGNLTVKEGDAIKVFFLKADNGEMRFTVKLQGEKGGSSLLESAFQNKMPVEGVVEKEIKGGYEVKLGDVRAFCPYSQMGSRRVEDASIYVGKRLTFKIQEYKANGRNILVSNRVIEEEARAEKLEGLKGQLTEGAVVKATVKSLQSFGAFVDLGGVQALLPISEIGRDRVEDISTVLSVGQEIEVQLLRLDWKNERLSVSMKRLLSDPWPTARQKYPANTRIEGKIARITNFGAFITLEPGLEGLLHVSELRSNEKYDNPLAALKVGETMSVQVIEVDLGKKRISLKRATSAEEEATSKKYMGDDGDTYNPFAALLKKK
jgi:small subunit ribosomal protein S1